MTRIGKLAGSHLLIAVLAIVSSEAPAAVVRVCQDGSGDHPTIQAAIDAANTGDEIVVCDGTYQGPGNRDIDFKGKALTLRSENGPDQVIIDCQNAGRASAASAF